MIDIDSNETIQCNMREEEISSTYKMMVYPQLYRLQCMYISMVCYVKETTGRMMRHGSNMMDHVTYEKVCDDMKRIVKDSVDRMGAVKDGMMREVEAYVRSIDVIGDREKDEVFIYNEVGEERREFVYSEMKSILMKRLNKEYMIESHERMIERKKEEGKSYLHAKKRGTPHGGRQTQVSGGGEGERFDRVEFESLPLNSYMLQSEPDLDISMLSNNDRGMGNLDLSLIDQSSHVTCRLESHQVFEGMDVSMLKVVGHIEKIEGPDGDNFGLSGEGMLMESDLLAGKFESPVQKKDYGQILNTRKVQQFTMIFTWDSKVRATISNKTAYKFMKKFRTTCDWKDANNKVVMNTSRNVDTDGESIYFVSSEMNLIRLSASDIDSYLLAKGKDKPVPTYMEKEVMQEVEDFVIDEETKQWIAVTKEGSVVSQDGKVRRSVLNKNCSAYTCIFKHMDSIIVSGWNPVSRQVFYMMTGGGQADTVEAESHTPVMRMVSYRHRSLNILISSRYKMFVDILGMHNNRLHKLTVNSGLKSKKEWIATSCIVANKSMIIFAGSGWINTYKIIVE